MHVMFPVRYSPLLKSTVRFEMRVVFSTVVFSTKVQRVIISKDRRMNIAIGYPALPIHLERIRNIDPDFTVNLYDPTDLTDALCESDILCGHVKGPVDWESVISAGKLKWIQSSAAGTDHCLPKQVIESDILVCSASGVFANQVAEQTMALLYGLIRSLPVFFRQAQQKQFVRQPTDDLHGKSIGIIGYGGNGQRIAELLAPLGCRISATDLFAGEISSEFVNVYSHEDLETVLQSSDVVIATVPLTEQTYEMFDQHAFASMKRGAYFINVARGQVVNESALIDALDGHLSGAGLDVTATEPLPESSPLWEKENVIITPHVGAQSSRRVDDSTELFCQNLARFIDGQPLFNLVDKRLGFPRPKHRRPIGKR